MPTLHQHRQGSRQNAKTWANQFKARILEPGIVSYEDCDCGKALLAKETIDKCINSFIGRPLILTKDKLNRPTYQHAKVTTGTLEQMADGYIAGVEYNAEDGWWYATGTVHNDEAKRAIQEVGLVSCAYDVLDTAQGGSYHNIPYNEEITAFEGEHLAIVDNPRYESATIRLNAKTKPKKHMFKWIKNALASKPDSSTQSGELPEGASLQVGEQQIPVADLVATHQRVNSVGGEELSGESEIDIEGTRVSINTLIASHQKLNAFKKKNAAEEEDEKKNAAEEEDKKENAAEEEEDEKKNAAEEEDEKKENSIESELASAERELAQATEQIKREREKDGHKSPVEKMPSYQKAKALARKVDELYAKAKQGKSFPAPKSPSKAEFDTAFNSKSVFRVNSKPGPLTAAREAGQQVELSNSAPDTIEARQARAHARYGPKNLTSAK